MRPHLFYPLLLIPGLVLAACDDDDDPPETESFAATLDGAGVVHEIFLAPALSGDNEVPPVTTTATGDATFTAVGTSLSYTVNVDAIDDATAAHIHTGAAGANGDVIVSLFAGPATGAGFSGPLAEDEVEVEAGVLEQMRTGDTYVNVHTTANEDGEIRDQVELYATQATGTATFTLDGLELSYSVSVNNIDEATAAHVHTGAEGTAGAIIVPLFAGPTTAADFSGVLAEGTTTVTEEIISQLRSGDTYVNVHTTQNPLGDIRGQVIMN